MLAAFLSHPVRRVVRAALVVTVTLVSLTVLLVSVAPRAVATSFSVDPVSELRGLDFARMANDLGQQASEVTVARVVHGDLDGDGDRDAAVVLSFRLYDSERWAVQAYRNDGDVAVPAGRTRDFGQTWERFDRMIINEGVIEFTVLSGDEQGTGWLSTVRWDLVNGSMRFLENSDGGVWVALGPGASPAVVAMQDARTYIDVPPDAVEASFRFSTDRLRSIQMRSDDSLAELRVYSMATKDLAATVDVSAAATLPAGEWIAVPVVSSNRTVRLRIAVADRRVLYAPQLSVRVREGNSDQQSRHDSVSVAWHEVTWAHGETDLDLVNGQISSFVHAIEREHAAVTSECAAGTTTSLVVGSTATLVSYDLVSFDFSIMTVGCNEVHEYDSRSLTIDLVSGQQLDNDDFFGATADVFELWWQKVVSRSWNDPVSFARPAGTRVDFASVWLDPFGLGISIAGRDLGEAFAGPVTMHLGWDDLGETVNAELRLRAASGVTVRRSEQGCGC